MKITLFYIALIALPCCLKAQSDTGRYDNLEFRPGLLKKDIRNECHSKPQYYKIALETDTLDSYLFQNTTYRMNYFYKNDTCYKAQIITPFDHTEIKNIAKDSFYKKAGKDTWVYSDGIVEIKITFDRSKDLSTMEATLVNNKPKK